MKMHKSCCGEITEPYEPKDSPIGFTTCGITVLEDCRLDVVMGGGQRVQVGMNPGFCPLAVTHILRAIPETAPVFTVRYDPDYDMRRQAAA